MRNMNEYNARKKAERLARAKSLKEMMKREKLNKTQLADKLGISRQRVGQLLR